MPLLRSLVETSGQDVNNFTVHDFIIFVQNLYHSQKSILAEEVKLANILIVMPATNAVSERSFSALKRTKTYLLLMSSDNRINHLMLLHIHQGRLDNIDNITAVAYELVGRFGNRKQIFGKICQSDMP